MNGGDGGAPDGARDGLFLAIETSGPVGSVALGEGPDVLARGFLGERGGHARAAIPAIQKLFDSTGRSRDALTGVVVGAGPGSFTGVRVAGALAKGIASALGIPLWAISSLTAASITDESFPEPQEVAHRGTRWILFDARGGRLFAAAYAMEPGGAREVRAPAFTNVEEVLADTELADAELAGDGAVRNAERFTAAGRIVLAPPIGFPAADALLRIHRRTPEAEPVDLDLWEPTYLRASNAERERAG